MRDCLYEKEGYIIFKTAYGYILHNTKKPFEDGHTHLEKFESGITLVDHCIKKKIPDSRKAYMYTSLIRLTDDERYKQSLRTLMQCMARPNTRKKKKKKGASDVKKYRM